MFPCQNIMLASSMTYIGFFSVENIISNLNHTYKKTTNKNKNNTQCRNSIFLLRKVDDIFLVPMKKIGHLSRFWLSCLGTLVFFLTKILKLFGFPILESKTSCTCVLGVSILPLLPFFYCISELFWQCGILLLYFRAILTVWYFSIVI